MERRVITRTTKPVKVIKEAEGNCHRRPGGNQRGQCAAITVTTGKGGRDTPREGRF